MSCDEWQWTLCPLAIKLFTLTQTATLTQRDPQICARQKPAPCHSFTLSSSPGTFIGSRAERLDQFFRWIIPSLIKTLASVAGPIPRKTQLEHTLDKSICKMHRMQTVFKRTGLVSTEHSIHTDIMLYPSVSLLMNICSVSVIITLTTV